MKKLLTAAQVETLIQQTPPSWQILRPQPGPQTLFLSTPADICIYGGSAGGGKSYGLLLEAIRHISNQEFGAVIFRRTYKEVRNEGGLWDESSKIYPYLKGSSSEGSLEWTFPSGARVRFSHLQHEKDKFSWQGSQIPLIGFDELTHFSKSQFFYLLSRNRSTCGVRPYIRATCNPDADSWVKLFIAPWVHEDWPMESRAVSGEIRYFLREGDELRWLPKGERHPDAKSVTFIEADVYDNPALLQKDPDYLKNLLALPLVERERLLYKNWKIRSKGGKKFKREWFPMLEEIPQDIERVVRSWDFAATEGLPANSRKDGPDYTASVKMARRKEGAYPRYLVLHASWDRLSPGKVEEKVRRLAEQDGRECEIYFEEEPGASGKANTFNYKVRVLTGFAAHGVRSSGSKEVRANTASSQAEAGNVGILRGYWNDGFFNFVEAFPNDEVHDDVVDSLSGAMEPLFLKKSPKDHLKLLAGLVQQSEAARQPIFESGGKPT